MTKNNDTASFASLDLAAPLLRAIKDSGYTTPTPIQQRMIPLIRDGRDVIGLSQTGTGKTAAFVLPILNDLATKAHRARRGGCSALIISPTRELTNQIADTVRRYGRYVDYRQVIVVGGASYQPQIRAIQRGVDIVIATPGRALDHLESGVLDLSDTTMVVLDEADQMLDFGFLPVVKQILGKVTSEHQTVLLSATMPKSVKALTSQVMTSPQTIEASPESRPVDAVVQRVIHLDKSRKNMALLEILSQQEVETAIVFARTKFGTERLKMFLNKYGIVAVSLHGDKSQGQRQKALAQFRSGEVPVLVATDVAGRGIDVSNISHVINFDLPNIAENYVHRIGRTARAGKTGIAISFCSKSEKSYLRAIEKLIGTSIDTVKDVVGSPPPVAADRPSDRPPNKQGSKSRDKKPFGKSTQRREGEKSPQKRPHKSRDEKPSRPKAPRRNVPKKRIAAGAEKRLRRRSE